ncbi:MAG: UDP-N-acetylglucosamine 1-carboxyvinyltransferase, partial [Pseudomonadota bacterium]
MDILEIRGGINLKGKISASGAKNAALPIMCAALLSDETVELSNLPDVIDIVSMGGLLICLGCEITHKNQNSVLITAKNLKATKAPYRLVRKMRASILAFGPLLAREKIAQVSLPGGCAIGARPIDLHAQAMRDLGADTQMENGYLVARAPKNGLVGGRITFSSVSVGASENAIMAACLARGETVIENVACEPEIMDLVACLKSMGAIIEGEGTRTIHIQGQSRLHSAKHSVIADRIEVGSYLMAVAATQGQIVIDRCNPEHLTIVLDILQRAGCSITTTDHTITLKVEQPLLAQSIATEVYPGYPTDLQAQFMALMTQARGISLVHESIFENRFMHVPELIRFGSDITIDRRTAIIKGPTKLQAAPVMATDLRASMSLVIAALACQGCTQIRRIYH